MTAGRDDDFLLHFARTAVPGRDPGRIGVAVSGGSDSMAALHLLHAAGWTVAAVTVDHGLRPEAAAEARFVAGACKTLGVPHGILKWQEGPAETGNLMAQARTARYRLIAQWAARNKLEHVVVAHTADDQAETFLMRLARDAGIDGLAAMRKDWDEGGIRFQRPFLALTRNDLRRYLERHGIGWIEDPTNSDDRFDRARTRNVLAALAPLGIDAGTLSGVAIRLASARQVLVEHAMEAADKLSRVMAGDVIFERTPFALLPPETARRLTIAALRYVSGAEYPPREEKLIDLDIALRAGRSRTLAGTRISVIGGQVRFTREARAVAGLCAASDAMWDGRWRLDGPHRPGLAIRQLGAEGLTSCPGWRDTGLPRATLLASPAVWDGDRLVAAPLAGLANGWTAELAEGRNSLSQFLMSH